MKPSRVRAVRFNHTSCINESKSRKILLSSKSKTKAHSALAKLGTFVRVAFLLFTQLSAPKADTAFLV